MNATEIKKTYYDDGKLFSITPYINGIKNGIEKWFYKSGAIRCEICFKNDVQLSIVWHREKA